MELIGQSFMILAVTVDQKKEKKNKARYTATSVAFGWAGAVFEVTWSFEQEQWGLKPQKNKKK